MGRQANLHLAGQLLKLLAEGATPADIAALFSPDVRFEIPGDDGILPWICRKSGRGAVIGFVTGLRAVTEPVTFDVNDVLASDTQAVILVDFVTRIKANGQIIVSSAAIVLEISNVAITRFLMIEDSFEVSRKARGVAGPIGHYTWLHHSEASTRCSGATSS